MIIQRFMPTLNITNLISTEGFGDEFSFYYNNLLDNLSFKELDTLIEQHSLSFSKHLTSLSEYTNIDECVPFIKKLPPEEKFILQNYLSISVYYKDFHVEMLPMFPIEKIPFNYFAYLEQAFFAFQFYCNSNKLSITEEVYSLSLDNYHQQNT